MDIDPEKTPLVFAIVGLAFVAVTACRIWGGIWVYGDAAKQGKNGVLMVLLCLCVAFPLSLLIWRWVRPPFQQQPSVK